MIIFQSINHILCEYENEYKWRMSVYMKMGLRRLRVGHHFSLSLSGCISYRIFVVDIRRFGIKFLIEDKWMRLGWVFLFFSISIQTIFRYFKFKRIEVNCH